MIFGNIKDVEEYGFLEENVLKCLEYAKNNELVDFEKGSHEIEGDNLFVNDFLPLEGEKNSHVVLSAGDFLICYPKDGHRTAIQVNGPEQIKKAIFKIRIK